MIAIHLVSIAIQINVHGQESVEWAVIHPVMIAIQINVHGQESVEWAVIHPVMIAIYLVSIAIQINVHGQESVESVIPKTLNTFIESQSYLQCDIRQQNKSAVLRNHWTQIQCFQPSSLYTGFGL
ncbi:hypothetical protein BLOT_003308, partial [Blomia tropicalis]